MNSCFYRNKIIPVRTSTELTVEKSAQISENNLISEFRSDFSKKLFVKDFWKKIEIAEKTDIFLAKIFTAEKLTKNNWKISAVMSGLMAGESWKSEKHSFQVLSSAFVFVEKYPFVSRIPTRISDLRNKIYGYRDGFHPDSLIYSVVL